MLTICIFSAPRADAPAIAEDVAHHDGSGELDTGIPSVDVPVIGAPGVGAPGVGGPGAGVPGVVAPGAGTPGAGTPGAGQGANPPTGVGADGNPCGGRNPDGLINGALDGVNTALCEGVPETVGSVTDGLTDVVNAVGL